MRETCVECNTGVDENAKHASNITRPDESYFLFSERNHTKMYYCDKCGPINRF